MEERFRETYDKYIDEILNEQLNLKRHGIEESLQKLLDTNQEILRLINQKINEILYKNKSYKMEVEFAEKAVFNGEDINVNVLIEKNKRVRYLIWSGL